MKGIYIVGAGGFAREVFYSIQKDNDLKFNVLGFIENDDEVDNSILYCFRNKDINIPVYNEREFNYDNKNVIIAVGNPRLRENIYYHIIKNFKNIEFPNVISSNAILLSNDTIKIGKGCIICAGCVLTCNIVLKDFINLNLCSTLGHDVFLDNFTTTATNVSISGKVNCGQRVYFGNNSAVKENIEICHDVIIGMGGMVVKDIKESGTYVGAGVTFRRIK
jgi:sugar O-acyltransferase (sialic acid O-acetyltransferase NeuD family)